jgi:DNA-binding MarR family transcriptional regulator
MNSRDEKLRILKEATSVFGRIIMRYEALRDEPITIADSDVLYSSQIHAIEAIGNAPGSTVTSLKRHFGVTKGAVSQIVTKLEQRGYVRKVKKEGNDKEKVLQLTEKGLGAFAQHEKIERLAGDEVAGIARAHTCGELQAFLAVLKNVDGALERFMKEREHEIHDTQAEHV